jgi:hypothetical protein
VGTNDSLDCTNEDDVILFLFPELFAFLSDLESELLMWIPVWLDEVFRLNSDYCPLLATAPTIPMPSLLDTKNQSNKTIPSECHLTLYETVDFVVNPLPLEDLPIVGHFDKTTKVMMHGDEGIGVDGLKELDPDPSTHDGIMEHGPNHIHSKLVPPLPVASNHVISAFQQKDTRPFLLSKSRQPMTTLTTIPTPFQLIHGLQQTCPC